LKDAVLNDNGLTSRAAGKCWETFERQGIKAGTAQGYGLRLPLVFLLILTSPIVMLRYTPENACLVSYTLIVQRCRSAIIPASRASP
jgi:hypothetical protein